jgi:hypothetical protein
VDVVTDRCPAVDREVEDSAGAQRAVQLAHHTFDVLNVVDAVLDQREVERAVLAGKRLADAGAVLCRGAPQGT